VFEAVHGYWRTIVESGDPPDPDHPGFLQFFTGTARERSVAVTRELARRGERAIDPGGVEVVGAVLSRDGPDEAIVSHCMVDDAVVVAADGSIVDDSVNVIDVELHLERIDGEWAVTANDLQVRAESVSCDG
jgi:hypothetical protein